MGDGAWVSDCWSVRKVRFGQANGFWVVVWVVIGCLCNVPVVSTCSLLKEPVI